MYADDWVDFCLSALAVISFPVVLKLKDQTQACAILISPPSHSELLAQVHKKQQYFLSLEHFLYTRADRMMENDYQTLCHPFLNPTRWTKSPCRKMIATLWLTAIKKRKHFWKKKMLFGFAWTVEQEPFTKVKFARHVCVMCSNLGGLWFSFLTATFLCS